MELATTGYGRGHRSKACVIMLNADVAGAVGLLYIYYHAVYKAQQRPISLMVRTVDSDSTGPGSIPGLAFLFCWCVLECYRYHCRGSLCCVTCYVLCSAFVDATTPHFCCSMHLRLLCQPWPFRQRRTTFRCSLRFVDRAR